jgi:carbon monoxide dehydrogenase subunit G
MEKLLNEFVVNRPIEETWTVLTDVERIAPCMPGAQLQEIEGDRYRGVVKVKLGAIATAFKGEATFVERDDVNHRAVLHGEGRDTTGKGNADAMITASLQSISAGETKVVVETDLRVTGKVAQFGRGIMGDVSKKLMAQFAANLNTMLDAPAAPAAEAAAAPAEAAPEAAAPPADADAADGAAADAASTIVPPTVRKIEGPANEPIELSGVAGTAVLKRVLPALGGLVLLLLILRRLGKR